MATPVWSTTAGKIATIDEQVAFSLQLEANDPVAMGDSTAITYSLIAGSLPAGMQVTTDGVLTGTPAEVAKRTLYTFVVRATAGSAITDRTFTLETIEKMKQPKTNQHKKRISKSISMWWEERKDNRESEWLR